MLGRRTAFAVVVASAAAFSGGAALAASHGGSPQKLQPPKLLPMKPQAVTNVHITCHNHSALAASL
jgi:hypothetical protein